MKHFNPTDPLGQLAHLRVVAGDAPRDVYLELRYRTAGTNMASEFHRVADRHRLLESINGRARSTDVYIGCAPRARRAGTKDAVSQVWALWAECDGEAAAAAARAFIPKPALVVASGSAANVHAYWPLREPVSALEAEKANLRLATRLGADLNCFDASRILRPPGTWNHKTNPPRRVELVEHRLGVRFDLDEVVGGLRHVDVGVVDRRWRSGARRCNTKDPLLSIAPPIYVRELLGVDVRGGYKVQCPFHADERPSLHVYRAPERGWTCFSCRRGGSIYDLAAAVWGTGTRGREFVRLRARLLDVFAWEIVRWRSAADDHALNR
jgi:hypothetical protein